MKAIRFFLITLALFTFFNSSIQAQTTEGTDFWVTFGDSNFLMIPETADAFDFRIRIVGGNEPTLGTIFFTALGTSIPFSMAPYEIYTYI